MKEWDAPESYGGMPYSLHMAMLGEDLEDIAQKRGFGVIQHTRVESPVEELDELQSGRSLYDLQLDELPEAYKILAPEALQSAKLQLLELRKALPRCDSLPEWSDFVAFTVDGIGTQIRLSSTHAENLGGPNTTIERTANQTSALLSITASDQVAVEIMGSRPTGSGRRPLNSIVSDIEKVYAGLSKVGQAEITPKERKALRGSLGRIERVDLEYLEPEDVSRLNLFRSTIHDAARRSVEYRNDNFRLYDMNSSPTDVVEKCVKNSISFIKALSDEEVSRVLSDENLYGLVVDEMVRTTHEQAKTTFLSTVPAMTAISDKGRNIYRDSVRAIEKSRPGGRDEAITSEGFGSKAEVFEQYLPELRRMSVILGGSFYDISRVYEFAANVLDDAYNSADQDIVELPSPAEIYLFLACEFRLGLDTLATPNPSTLSDKEKTSIMNNLDAIYKIAVERQYAPKRRVPKLILNINRSGEEEGPSEADLQEIEDENEDEDEPEQQLNDFDIDDGPEDEFPDDDFELLDPSELEDTMV